MNLRELAESDLATTLEDSEFGFGTTIVLTEPDGTVHTVHGQYTRIGVENDPETGLQVVGQKSAVTVRLSSLCGSLPADGWLIEVKDITGQTVKGKASMTMLDRTLGIATMILRR